MSSTGSTLPLWHTQGLPLLVERKELPEEVIGACIADLTAGQFQDEIAASFLIALRMKGETGKELASAVRVLRSKMIPLRTVHAQIVDTCGTGGDGSGTFNISTAVSLVVAAAGVPVVKHGNRSVSSRSGSADVLAELGLSIESGTDWAQRCLDEHLFAFCFAPHFHPALAKVGPLRRKLGVRTIFNLLGPLLNPAGAPHQLLGVGHRNLLDPMAAALAELGTRKSLVVCGADGLDEISLSANTFVRIVTPGHVEELEWEPGDFGLDRVDQSDLLAANPQESAVILRKILARVGGPSERVVLANAAGALMVGGKARDLKEGVEMAKEAIHSGRAAKLLETLTSTT